MWGGDWFDGYFSALQHVAALRQKLGSEHIEMGLGVFDAISTVVLGFLTVWVALSSSKAAKAAANAAAEANRHSTRSQLSGVRSEARERANQFLSAAMNGGVKNLTTIRVIIARVEKLDREYHAGRKIPHGLMVSMHTRVQKLKQDLPTLHETHLKGAIAMIDRASNIGDLEQYDDFVRELLEKERALSIAASNQNMAVAGLLGDLDGLDIIHPFTMQ